MAQTGIIEGYLEFKIGEQVLLAVDFLDENGQSFTISSAEVSVYDKDDTITAIVDRSATITTGLNSSVRVQRLITDTETGSLTEGPHKAIWKLTFSDTQIFYVRQALDVVPVL